MLLGGDSYIPDNIDIKDSRMFLSGYSTRKLNVDFDTRAYSFNSC